METALGGSPPGSNKEINGSARSFGSDDDDREEAVVLQVPSQHGHRSNSSSPERKDAQVIQMREADDQLLEMARAEMGEVKQENERLKTTLAQIRKDYQSLQMRFLDVVGGEVADESQLVSLSLGTNSARAGQKREEAAAAGASRAASGGDEPMEELLSLGLPGGSQPIASPGSSFDDAEEEDQPGCGPPSKVPKTARGEEGEPAPADVAAGRRARVSVRVRCDTPTMNDGCQWRKYGQKIAKGNPCPRAYYRCTVAPACPVRKQVQRCAEDISILITTYEGTHNHPLPVSATAMASTTSAAASMLMSGSTTSSGDGYSSGAAGRSSSDVSTDLHGLNFSRLHNNIPWPRQHFYPPTSYIISSSPSCPTVTLDLTAPPSSSAATAAPHFSRIPSFFSAAASYPHSGFTFSSSRQSSSASTAWNGVGAAYHDYATQHYLQSAATGRAGRTPREPFCSTGSTTSFFLQRPAATAGSAPEVGGAGQPALTETAIAAATRAITSDPSFQSALAAAITSMVGGKESHAVAETLRRNLGWEEQASPPSIFPPSAVDGSAHASSYRARTTSTSPCPKPPQQGSLGFLQTSLVFSNAKNSSDGSHQRLESI